MVIPYIISLNSFDPIDPNLLFGKEAQKLLAACYQVLHAKLYPYEGCFHASTRPTIIDLKRLGMTGAELISAYKAEINEWKVTNPVDFAKECASRANWEENYQKQFRIIYGIARRHKCYLTCDGLDKWTIYKNNAAIGRICCI